MKIHHNELKKLWLAFGIAAVSLGASACTLTPEDAQLFEEEEDVRSHEQRLVISIASLADLRAMGTTGDYELAANIDASATQTAGQEFEPIGEQSAFWFSGTFDGNGYTISDLKIKSGVFGTGLFAGTDDSEVRNVKLTNVSATGQEAVGGLVGWASRTTMKDSSVTGTVTGTAGMSARASAGLLVGKIGIDTLIDRSWAQGTVNGLVQSAGGIVGKADGTGYSNGGQPPHIREAFADVTISPTFGSPATIAAGGIVGELIAGRFEDVLSTGAVLGDYSGGVVGAIYFVDDWEVSWLRSGVTHAVVTVNNVPNRTGAIGYYDTTSAIGDCRGVLYNTTTDGGTVRPDSTACQAGLSESVLRAPKPAPDPFYYPYIFGSQLPPSDPSYPAGSDGTWNFSAWALNSASEYATLLNIPWSIQPK
ncbi:GLUG motif-containing protein [Sorangium sp. So ce362]|uniref:GLUG motif-containing protein n=1 Tax=Sorangium sp. So ce362 TaxID=3133303 RepID=UPI003F6470D8